MLRGLTTVNFFPDDLSAARDCNILSVTYNQHYLDILGTRTDA